MKSSRFLAPFAGALLFASAMPGLAGVNSWTLGGPPGGHATAVAVSPVDPAILLASMGNGLYRSTDSGATWTFRADVFGAQVLVFDPSNSHRVFALRGEGRIVRSEDDAATFTQLSDPPNYTSGGDLSVANDGTLYVADQRGALYKSVNAGSAWTSLSTPWPLADDFGGAIIVDPANANNVLVGIRGVGTYRSVDGGATWTALAIPNSPGTHSALERVLDFAFKPGASNCVVASSDAGLQVSTDGGATWSSPVGSFAMTLAFDPAQPTDVVAVDQLARIWRSTNSGTTWTMGAELHLLPPTDLAFGANHRALLAGSDGPMVSDDGGVTFALKNSGILAQSVRAFARGGDGNSPLAAFTPGPFGVYELVGTWQPLANAGLRANLQLYPSIPVLAVAPHNPNWIHAVGTLDSFMTSFDRGQTWTQPLVQFQNSNIGIQHIVVDPSDGKIVYVTTQADGVWRSENNGLSFVKRSAGLPTQVFALAINPTNSAVLYAGDAATVSSGIWKSVDSGVTWAPLGTATLGTSAVSEIIIDPSDPLLIYASLRDGLHRSTDGGNSWVFMGPAGYSGSAVILDPEFPHTIIYGGAAGSPGFPVFARSVDDGAHWQTVPSAPVHPTLGAFEQISFDRGSNTVFAGGYGTGLHQYMMSTNLAVELGAVPAAVALNSTGTFQVIVRNLGPFDAAAPRLDIRVPTNASVPTPPAGCQPFQDVYRCILPGLRNGQSQTFTLDYTAAATASNGDLQANVFAREYDAVNSDDVVVTTVLVRSVTDLGVTSTAPAAVQTNAPIAFSAKVTNSGPNDSATTTYVLTMPASVTAQTATATAGSCTIAAPLVTCELGALANGASATISVSATATQAATLAWASLVRGSGEDPASTNNTVSASTTATTPPPPPPPPSSGGGGGGGGRLDWPLLALLGISLLARRRVRRAAY